MPDQSPQTISDRPPQERLGSWKEIAAYLGREVRTVQRWEKTDGLPVHRLHHSKRGSVYALPLELDRWWESRRDMSSDDESAEVGVSDKRVELSNFSRVSFWLRWAIPAICLTLIAGLIAGWQLRNSSHSREMRVLAVTNFPGDEETPSLSRDGQQAAFSWNGLDGRNYDIYVTKIGEGGIKRLTTAPEWDFSPAWSPVGDQIAFLRSNSATLSGTDADILLVSPNGGPERKIGRVKSIGVALAWKKRQIAWTPDAKWLIVSGTDSDDPEGLLLVSAAGGTMRRLTLPAKGQFDLEPTVSPDGRLLVFRREVSYTVPELYVVPLGSDFGPTGPERPVQTHPQVHVASPQWEGAQSLLYVADGILTRLSTDAMGIAAGVPQQLVTNMPNCGLIAISYEPNRHGAVLCTCERDEGFVWKLELPASLQSAGLKRVTTGQAVAISPDGKQIAVELSGPDGTNIWIEHSDGSSPRKLTRAEHALADSPAWSPDGRWIAFDANFEGRPSIYVTPAGGGSPRRLTNMLPDCSIPSWSRDGKSIYFAAKIADKFEVVRMPTEGGEFTQITHGGGTASSESVDGRYIYYNRRIQESWSLRRSNRDGGQDEEVIPNMQDRAFAVSDSGIYFIPMPGADGRSSICFLNIASREVTSITSIQKPQRRPIVLAPDGSFLLFSQLDHWGRDLALLEGVP